MRRRDFLGKAVFTTAIIGFSALPYGLARLLSPATARPRQNHLRPPGALKDDKAFNAACIGCGLCGEVCPVRAIRFHDRTGGDRSNTPYIDPSIKGCILCGLCMKHCPTDALQETPIRKIDMGVAQIDRVACYPWVDRGICGACVSICPLGEHAIGFKAGNIYRPVVKRGCVGCGLCVEVCPEPSLAIRIVDRSEGTVAKHGIGIRRKRQ